MKQTIVILLLISALSACQKSEVVSQYTGNEVTYALQQSSTYDVSGTITFRERKDGQIYAVIQMSGVSGSSKHPVHLHLGDITVQGADVALLMEPVDGTSGHSETIFNKLSDESIIDYQKLTKLNACIKIHLSSTGAGKDVVLAAGNIGTAVTAANPGGRTTGVGLCKSE